MPRRTATLEDVARAAGVSQQTVSRVLNRPEVVSARTREQVIRAMQTLHYVPNRSAQLLAGKAAPSIGLITASLTLHAPSQIAAAIKSHASLHQLEVAIAMPAQADFVALQARLDELRAQHIRGVIVSLTLESATAEGLVQENPDMACLFLDVSPEADVCCVRFDHRDGCGACVRHLWELGHREFGLLAGPESSVSARLRLASWREALHSLNIAQQRCSATGAPPAAGKKRSSCCICSRGSARLWWRTIKWRSACSARSPSLIAAVAGRYR